MSIGTLILTYVVIALTYAHVRTHRSMLELTDNLSNRVMIQDAIINRLSAQATEHENIINMLTEHASQSDNIFNNMLRKIIG